MHSTTDPALQSWVPSANHSDTDFPVQNLPYGVFRSASADRDRIGVAIGDKILDLSAALELGAFDNTSQPAAEACGAPRLNALMALGPTHWRSLRGRLSELLREEIPAEAPARDQLANCLVDQDEVSMRLPADVGDYTDFYASVYHATNVGSMFRPDNPLLPNYKHIPIAYHGRASSLVASDTPIVRPSGQTKADDADAPSFRPCKLLDYELEMGVFVGNGNRQGMPIPIGEAGDHLFGMCIVNDWSARDIQKWEYQPLGPFLSKSFATTLSPWVVTMAALRPFRCSAFDRPEGDPVPLPYLSDDDDAASGGLSIDVEVYLSTTSMREKSFDPFRLTQANFSDMYWTVAQMLTHHTSNGCNVRPGDLLASGTVSGKDKGARGCLLELTWRGSEPVELPTGEQRKFLQDGDEVEIRAFCKRDGARRIGFGSARGIVEGSRV